MVSKRYLLGGAGLAAIGLLPLVVRHDELVWELIQLAGLFSAIGCLLLTAASVRPRDARPSRLLTLDQHKWVAWICVALLTVHIGGVLLADRHALEYLKPSMPAYQLAGLLATLVLIVLSVTALSRVRRFLWQRAASFRALHVLLAVLVVVLIFIHVVATDRYSAGPGRWLWTGVTLFVLVLPLAYGGYGKSISLAFLLAGLACLGLAAQREERRAQLMLETFVPRAEPLMVDFPHERHGAVNCIACHHNFVDRSGGDSCIPCHRSERPDLLLGAQARFHTFCMDCHREEELPKDGSGKHGPVSECSACHRTLD